MFRELTRRHKQLPMEACLSLLKNETRGVLSVLGDDGYPYGVPMNYLYWEEDGCLYFHCGKQKSHRNDALRRCGKASFCVYDRGVQEDSHWAFTVSSVILFGRVTIIDDTNTVLAMAAHLSRKFTADEDYIRQEIQKSGPATLLLKFTPEHICGKRIVEA